MSKPTSTKYLRKMAFNDGQDRSYLCHMTSIFLTPSSINVMVERVDEADMLSEHLDFSFTGTQREGFNQGKALARFNKAQDPIEEGMFDAAWEYIIQEKAEWLAHGGDPLDLPDLNPVFTDVT